MAATTPGRVRRPWVRAVAPARVPLTEPEGFAQAVLGHGLGERGFWPAVAEQARRVYVPLSLLALLGLAVAAVLESTWLGLGCLAVAAATDWAGTVGGAEPARLLDRAGAHGRLRALLRSVGVLALLANADSSDEISVVLAYAVVVVVSQLGWLTYAVGSAWLAQRQPPLLVRTREPQPAVSLAFARAYSQASGVSATLLSLDVVAVAAIVVGMHTNHPGRVASVAAVVVSLAVLALAARAGRATLRLGTTAAVKAQHQAVLAELAAVSPSAVVYMSAGPGQSKYILNQWLSSFEAMSQPSFIMVREASQLAPIADTRLPLVYAPSTRHVEDLTLPGIRLAFYLANAGKNVHLLRDAAIKHVFLNHGDSDKSTSANPVARAYDEVWVAGQAAVDRYHAAGIDIAPERFAIVGRPQVESLLVGPLTGTAGKCVLYAPTFEGYYEESNYSSLERMGTELVRRMLAERPDVRILFKPHPASGVQRPGMRRARLEITRLLREAPAAPGHLVVDDEPGMTLYDCFAMADVLVSDVSSVVTDFLHTERPIVTSNPRDMHPDDFYTTFPTQQSSYVLDRALADLDAVMDDALGPDSMYEQRRAMKLYVLGDLPQGPLRAFSVHADRLVEQAETDLGRIQNQFRVKHRAVVSDAS